MTRDHEPPEAASGSSAIGSSLSAADGDEREVSALAGGFSWAGADEDEDRSDIAELYATVREYTADPAAYARRLAAAHEQAAEPYEEVDNGNGNGGDDPAEPDPPRS